jgi:hypothetical protein
VREGLSEEERMNQIKSTMEGDRNNTRKYSNQFRKPGPDKETEVQLTNTFIRACLKNLHFVD